MVDREARTKAGHLLRLYRDNIITNDDLESEWLRLSSDRATRAVANTIWATYSDMRTHLLGELDEFWAALFERCLLFLQSDLEYEWPREMLYDEDGPPLIRVALSLGLYLPFYFVLKRRIAEQKAAGESAVWPFLRRSDYERELSKAQGPG